ncbi:MAG: Asp-tRNA(Asn)/Glu-tRNA(Gln) amidotransferase subunit GatC [Terrisporobacter sp.]
MSINKEDIQYIAKLAKLKINDEEAETFTCEFKNILGQFKILEKLQLDDVPIETPSISVLRKDIVKKCGIDDLYRNAKKMRETSVEVPKIIE